MVTGTAAERRQILAEADSEDILLTSYDLLKRESANMKDISSDVRLLMKLSISRMQTLRLRKQ